ncbi:MAG: deoxyribodipyrimidine photo-lyase [Phycisphaerae bacterium]|nr:deoxyribodipyrimidine photo-lyase [Phycisphaerae bacterium]
MIEPQRIQALNDAPVARDRRCVLYWMQASQRAGSNHALEHACRQADELKLPVVVCFALTDDYPDANERHYAFMLEGLTETAAQLEQRGVRFVLRRGRPPEVVADLAEKAALIICDAAYLRHQRQWRRQVARTADCRVERVEADVVVPVAVVSDKTEYAARTIRPRHRRHWERFLTPLEQAGPRRDSLAMRLDGLPPDDSAALLARLDIDRSVQRTDHYHGGTRRARQRLKAFVRDALGRYVDERSDPSLGVASRLSAYLHFGQIAPVEIACAVRDADVPEPAKEAYLEELLIRRELAVNFAFHNPQYDRWRGLPSWARATLEAHKSDARPAVYTFAQLEAGDTHDAYWNAAMREMVVTGAMHNTMRMYWGKKIIEWTRSPRTAFRWMRTLNNRYFLDGRDPSSYANVGWCFGLHDRPWAERDVFGTVRYMSAGGLERKYDIDSYVRQCAAL